MIIIEKKKLCFIHIPKTSGSTLTKILYEYISKHHRKNYVYFKGNGWQNTHHIDKQHNSLNQSLNYLSNYKNYKFITIVRNPYDWIGSVWNNFYKNKYKTLKIYLKSRLLNREIYEGKKNQIEFIKNSNNIKIKIFKFEEEPIEKICKDFNIKYNKNIHLLYSPRDKYKSYNYDNDMIKIVNILFKKDFKYFNYKMIMDISELKFI